MDTSLTHFNFYGPDWTVMKNYLERYRAVQVAKLIGSKDHDDSMRLRGAIQLIDLLLIEEKAALDRAANRG